MADKNGRSHSKGGWGGGRKQTQKAKHTVNKIFKQMRNK